MSVECSSEHSENPASGWAILFLLPACVAHVAGRCIAGVASGECRVLLDLTLALFTSVVLHGGVLVLGHRLLGVAGEGDDLHAMAVNVSFRHAEAPGLMTVPVRDKPLTKQAESLPSRQQNQHRMIHPESDRVPHDEDVALEISANAGASNVMPSLGERYFKGSELTQRPHPVGVIELSYPASGTLRDTDRSGTIILRVLIAETGMVDQVLVETSNLPEALQEEAVLRFLQARFFPGRVDELAVKSQMRVEVTFQPGA